MRTQLIIYHRPFRSLITADVAQALSLATLGNDYSFKQKGNTNKKIDKNTIATTRPNSNSTQGTSIDLYDNVSIPINYTILDIREPEKRKTNWSKTITIPGTKNNNRVFDHIYEIGADGWVTIGNTTIYDAFNPNLKLECILMNDGVQVMKGNLQLKKITKDLNDNIEYEVAISGDLTSLFSDIGNSKLSDLDLSEWDHDWTKDNIENSWDGISLRNKTSYTSIADSGQRTIQRIFPNASSARLTIQTTTPHGYSVGDYVRLRPDLSVNSNFMQVAGEWQVVEVLTTTRFSVNYFYPLGLLSSGYTGTLGTVVKRIATGKGYVYPMISWGDEYDYNSFPVTSFVPGIYVKELLDKIFLETKSVYTSNFLNSQFFKRLILVQKKSSYDLNPIELKQRKFCVGTTQSYLTGASYLGTSQWYYPQLSSTSSATASIFPRSFAQNFPFKSESGSYATVSFFDNGLTEGGNSYGNWDNVTNKWRVQETGEYDLNVSIKVTAWCDMNGFGLTPGNGTASFNLTTYRYYPGSGGQYYNNGYESGPGPYTSTNKFTFGMQVKATLRRLRNGVVETIGENVQDFLMNNASYYTPSNPNWVNFGRYQPLNWRNQEFTVTSSSKYFAGGDEVWVELSHYVQAYAGSPACQTILGRKASFCFNQSGGPEIAKAIIGEWYLRVNEQSYIFNTPSQRTVEGSRLPMTSVLPKDLLCKDFLLGIFKMFNLHIEQDNGIDRKYYIEPRDDFYYDGSSSTDFLDWTDKVDKTSVEIIPMGELIAKSYVFENREESDYWNKRFKEDRGRPYQYYKKDIVNDFLKNEVKFSVPFGSSVMINNPEGSDVVMPAIIQRESNGSFKPVSNSLSRILIWGGLRPYSAQRGGAKINLSNDTYPNQFGWEMLSGSASAPVSAASASIYSYYPYAGTVDSPQDPINDINWFNMEPGDFVYYDYARWTNKNLYNKYWSNFINEISDPASKVIIANLDLKSSDIGDLDFKKIYLIDGHYLRLQKIIDYDPNSDGLTKCEFLKLKAPVKFSTESTLVNQWGLGSSAVSTTINSSTPIKVVTEFVAPEVKSPISGFNNSSAGVNLSNSVSVVTNGLSNFIAPRTRNIQITGNENSIGDNAENITISSGSGNFIAGGVKNVNVIGTDKKYIFESNVTYINGIRYVNGMAISKSNVINGGLDVAVIRQSQSTTANVINGAEDVVITAGSQTYENVINAGLNSILPDLPELGVSTTVNPNPRTNLSSGFEKRVVQQKTLVDLIRERAALR